MRYLYRIQPTRPAMLTEGPTPEERRIVGEHLGHLQGLTEQGVVVLAGRTLHTDESSFGIVSFNADSDDAASAVAEGDPAVRQGMVRAETFPYRVALISEQNARRAE